MIKRKKTFGSSSAAFGLVTALIFMIVSSASAAVFPGPDGFGYVAKGIGENLRTLGSGETFVSLDDDDVSDAIPIPFDFIFYGLAYNEVYISSNGFISFSPGQGDGFSDQGRISSIPESERPNNIIAGFWEDLRPPVGGTISYATIAGDNGGLEFVVAFNAIKHYPNVYPVTFQIILHEGSNNIELQYGWAESDGAPHTIGIENANGTNGLSIPLYDDPVYNDLFDHEGFLIHYLRMEKLDVQSANISFGRGQELDKYDIEGELSLSEFGEGIIDPISENFVITIGSSSLVIPAGSFKQKRRKSEFEFQGWLDGALMNARIKKAGPYIYRYSFDVHEVDLSESTIPINFGLRIGINAGFTTIFLNGNLWAGRKPKYSKHKTRLKDHLSKHKYYRRYRR